MCWSASVSIGTALLHYTTSYIVSRSTIRYRDQYLLFLRFYMVMELLQATQHIIIGIDETCNSFNQVSTVIAYVLIWMQPYLFLSLYEGSTGSRNIMMYRLVLITLGASVLFLFMGMASDIKHYAPNTNYDTKTCTKYGYGNHLDWRFSVKSIQYSPNYFIYLVAIIVVVAELPTDLFHTLGLGWLITLVMSVAWVGIGPVLPSVWCLNSVFVDIPILYKVVRHYII